VEKELTPLALSPLYASLYTRLVNTEPVSCITGKSYEDPVLHWMYVRHELVMVLGWNSASSTFGLLLMGPEKLYGAYGDVLETTVEPPPKIGMIWGISEVPCNWDKSNWTLDLALWVPMASHYKLAVPSSSLPTLALHSHFVSTLGTFTTKYPLPWFCVCAGTSDR
jgi:hypothetical protein